jgi:hypothetical protein
MLWVTASLMNKKAKEPYSNGGAIKKKLMRINLKS